MQEWKHIIISTNLWNVIGGRRNGLGPVPLNNEQPFKFAMSTYNRAAHHCVQHWTCVFTAFRDQSLWIKLTTVSIAKAFTQINSISRNIEILRFYTLPWKTMSDYQQFHSIKWHGNTVCEKDGSWWTRMVEEVPRTKFKMLITSRSRLSTADNSPYQHCGHCRPGAYPMLGVQLPSPLSFLPMVESLVTQLENVVISSLSCFCFDLLNCVYNWLFYTEVVH